MADDVKTDLKNAMNDVNSGINGLLNIIKTEGFTLIRLRKSLADANNAYLECQNINAKLNQENLLLKDSNDNYANTVLQYSITMANLTKENRRCHLKLKFIKQKSAMRKKRLDNMLKEKQKITVENLSNLIEEEHNEDLEESNEEEEEEEQQEGLDYGGGGGDIENVERRKEESEEPKEYNTDDENEALIVYSSEKSKKPKQTRLSVAKKVATLSRDIRNSTNVLKSGKIPSFTFDNIKNTFKLLDFARDRLAWFENRIINLGIMLTRSSNIPKKLNEFKEELINRIFKTDHFENLTVRGIKQKFYDKIGSDLSSTYSHKDPDTLSLLSDITLLYKYFDQLYKSGIDDKELKTIYTKLTSGNLNNNSSSSSSSSLSFKSSNSSSSAMKWNDFY